LDSPASVALSDFRLSWSAGHDFSKKPNPDYVPTSSPLRNLIRHGSFDWSAFGRQLGPWNEQGDAEVRVIRGKGGISSSYTKRDTIIGNGVRISGQENGSIRQRIAGLLRETEHEAAVWVKCEGDAEAELQCLIDGRPVVDASTTSSNEWMQMTIRFHSGEKGEVALVIAKKGEGAIYLDDVGCVPRLKGIPMGPPGMVP
jgi:hypothetical protein